MFYTFPGDQATWNSNTQFMIGDGLLVAPVLSENGTTADVYYPRGTWYSLYDSSVTDASDRSTNKTLEVRACTSLSLLCFFGDVHHVDESLGVAGVCLLWQVWMLLTVNSSIFLSDS